MIVPPLPPFMLSQVIPFPHPSGGSTGALSHGYTSSVIAEQGCNQFEIGKAEYSSAEKYERLYILQCESLRGFSDKVEEAVRSPFPR